MPGSCSSPSLVPYGADQTAYFVADRVSARDCAYRETEVERTDFEAIIADFLTGQFNDPIRVDAFNTLEHWSEDISEVVAAEIQTRCDIEGVSVPEHVRDFVDRHCSRNRSNGPNFPRHIVERFEKRWAQTLKCRALKAARSGVLSD